MKTAIWGVFFLCGMQAVGLAQLGVTELDENSETAGNSMEDILGKDFFDFRRPRTLRAPPTAIPERSLAGDPRNATGYLWDYRFDAQYQSTVKPYLRWYMRNDPNRPGERYLPRHMTSQGHYDSLYAYPACSTCGTSSDCGTGGCSMSPGYSGPVYGAPGCDGCGFGNQGFGYIPRSRYWQHLDYLQGQYGSTPPRPRRRSSQLDRTRTAAAAKTEAVKTVWVSRNDKTGGVSVLFVEPPAAQSHKFFKGTATLTSAMQLAGIKWIKEPEWSAEIKLAASERIDKS